MSNYGVPLNAVQSFTVSKPISIEDKEMLEDLGFYIEYMDADSITYTKMTIEDAIDALLGIYDNLCGTADEATNSRELMAISFACQLLIDRKMEKTALEKSIQWIDEVDTIEDFISNPTDKEEGNYGEN